MNNRQRAFDLTQGRCAYCGEKLRADFVLDHMIPKSAGGGGYENLVACCRDCNTFKGSLCLEEFRHRITSIIDNDFHGRIIKKFYGLKHRDIKFYFEKR